MKSISVCNLRFCKSGMYLDLCDRDMILGYCSMMTTISSMMISSMTFLAVTNKFLNMEENVGNISYIVDIGGF